MHHSPSVDKCHISSRASLLLRLRSWLRSWSTWQSRNSWLRTDVSCRAVFVHALLDVCMPSSKKTSKKDFKKVPNGKKSVQTSTNSRVAPL